MRNVLFGVLVILIPWTALAQQGQTQFGQSSSKGCRLDKEVTQRYRAGVIVTALGGNCQGILSTAPVPIDWPEQRVRVVEEDITTYAKKPEMRQAGSGARQMVVDMAFIPAGQEARAVITYEVTRSSLLPPDNTSGFILPDARRLDKETRLHLGPSPSIDVRHAKIRAIAKQLGNAKIPAWQKVEAIYNWVREKIEYQQGPMEGSVEAVRVGHGDVEDLANVFIALCRASDVPARMVWVIGTCYPEFYLQDAEGAGYWFPCQMAGTRLFGGTSETRPILMKGDNFTVPELPREKMRMVKEFLTGTGGSPQAKFVRELVDAGQK